ncbi:MAG: hypothetical protein FWG16_02720, partial [Micrococcales bacterium]|nr:hypothetical protein [Micrococcales bacterium]
DWLVFLEPHRDLGHQAMAQLASQHITQVGLPANAAWWAQGVTRAFEQVIGRRQPGQRSDGSFSLTVSATAPGDMDAALESWAKLLEAVTNLNGVPLAGPARTSATEKWRYWRCGLADGSTVSVNFQTKPGGQKTTAAVNHDQLTDPTSLDGWRAFWKEQLQALKAAT